MVGSGFSARVLARVAACAIGLHALTLVNDAPRRPDRPSPSRKPNPGAGKGETKDGWMVSVDGWKIEVDGVLAVGPPELPEDRVLEGAFSPYDGLIARYALAAGLDWRLISALIYEESRFQPYAESTAGAVGLMQVRSIAARQVGEGAYREPEANVRTGTRYLKYLHELFAGARERDRLALALAAYNMGPAHVEDAQRLARRLGFDPLRWDGSMEVMVEMLEEPRVCEDLPNGCAFGGQVVAYVDRVLTRFATYRRVRPALPSGETFSAVVRGGETAASGAARGPAEG